MKKITINVSKKYDVIVESGLFSHILDFFPSSCPGMQAVIISDSNVWPYYGAAIENALCHGGFSVNHYVFPAGEASKTPDTYICAVNYLSEIHFTRSDLLIALGGGVVGDLTGFIAATYLRGVSYIQIPTSLLAMVDSSVGGKTAIDLPSGKNLLGAFYQPNLVLCDIDTLNTLPADIFRDGCAEIIKYGILYDPDLFSHLETAGLNFDREYVISRCVELKKSAVTMDEFDTGQRQKLNLGHTIGHGIEAGSNFLISHGQAVAAGIAIVTKAAVSLGHCARETLARIIRLLNIFHFSLDRRFSAESLYTSALSDKKRSGNTVNLIIPKDIGHCIILPISVNDLQSFIEAGL